MKPKHKLFFGIPYGKAASVDKISPTDKAPETPTKLPCFTFDTSSAVFSSGSLRFDCDYDGAFLAAKELEAGGFTFDNTEVTMDTSSLIFN